MQSENKSEKKSYPPPINPLADEIGLVRVAPWMIKHICEGESLYAFKNFEDDYLWDGYYDGQECLLFKRDYLTLYVKINIGSTIKTIVFVSQKIDRLYIHSDLAKTIALRKAIYDANNGSRVAEIDFEEWLNRN